MKRVLQLTFVVLFGLLPVMGSAQQGQVGAVVTMSADRTRLEAGDIFRLTVEARVTGASNVQLQIPGLEAFDVVSRQVSTPFSLQFGVGGSTRQIQSTVRHVITLRARQVGRITLPAAFVELAGRRFTSNTLSLDVGGAPGDPGANAPTTAPTNGLPPAHTVDGMVFDTRGFLRTWVDDGEPYLGQQVTVTVYLYVPRRLTGSPQFTHEPTAAGFWVQDLLEPSRVLQPNTQALNGQRFDVYMLRRFAAFPLQAGELTIGAPTLSIQAGRSPFAIFGGGGSNGPTEFTGEPVTVTVQPLPEQGRPPGDPHVGSLQLEAEIDRAQVGTGDAITLTLTATGTGAMQQLRLANPEADGLRVLAPEVRDAVSMPNNVVGGTRTIRWLIVPEEPGTYSLGPFEVPVLNPADGTWTIARAPAIELIAAGNAAQAPAQQTADQAPAPVPPSEVTFGPVHTHSELARSYASFTSQAWFLALLALGPLGFLLGLGVRGAQRRAARGDPKGAPRRAQKAAQKRLAAAQAHADGEQPREFYGAIAGALKDVLEAKLGQAVGSLTHGELRKSLAERGMEEQLASTIVDELEGCDFARFSAIGVSSAEMQSCLDRTRELLRGLDRFTPTEEAP